MAPKTIAGSKKLSDQIRRRRLELDLTIEEAAGIANVGIKTWCRYEAGSSIRRDKLKGLLKALDWVRLPDDNEDDKLDLDYYRHSGAWSDYLYTNFGDYAAISFAAGSEILMDLLTEDLGELSKLSKGTHIGQLSISMLADDLPTQFLTEYNYDFLYRLRSNLVRLRRIADNGHVITVNSVLDELTLYLISEEAEFTMESCFPELTEETEDKDWVFEIIDDTDLIFCLYSDMYITEDNMYHFNNWGKPYWGEE